MDVQRGLSRANRRPNDGTASRRLPARDDEQGSDHDLRHLTKRAFITYALVANENERLLGVVVMREMLLGEDPNQRLDAIMLPEPVFPHA